MENLKLEIFLNTDLLGALFDLIDPNNPIFQATLYPHDDLRDASRNLLNFRRTNFLLVAFSNHIASPSPRGHTNTQSIMVSHRVCWDERLQGQPEQRTDYLSLRTTTSPPMISGWNIAREEQMRTQKK